MHNHFNQNLNLKALILEHRPKMIVECGAGNGDLTRQLASLLDIYPFELHVITDKVLEGLDSRIKWVIGLSYEELKKFESKSIGLCVIDTDHNYWTLMKEFSAAFDKIREDGYIALHDVETFYHDTGMALSYWDGKPYPKEEIEKFSPYGGLGDALIEFLHIKNMNYRLVSFTTASHGAALIQRKTQPIFSVVIPGPKPVYAQIQKEAVHAGI